MIGAALIPPALMLVAGMFAFGILWLLSPAFPFRKRETSGDTSDAVSPAQAIEAGRCLIRKRRGTLHRA